MHEDTSIEDSRLPVKVRKNEGEIKIGKKDRYNKLSRK